MQDVGWFQHPSSYNRKVPRVLIGVYKCFTNWICQVRPYKSSYLHHGPYKSSWYWKRTWVVIKACLFSKSATLDGSTHLMNFEIVQTQAEMMSEAGDAFLRVHLDHVQPKLRSQDYAITSRSAIWLQNSSCARTWANSKDAEKMFAPRPLAKDNACQEWVLKDKLDKHNAWCVACEIQLFFFVCVFLTVATALTKSNTCPYKSLYGPYLALVQVPGNHEPALSLARAVFRRKCWWWRSPLNGRHQR